MAPVDYLLLRAIRHFMPAGWVKWLLKRSLIIQSGTETKDPDTAVTRYLDTLHHYDQHLKGKAVFLLGYGGRFHVGVGLLEAGASKVTFCDPFVTPDMDAARQLSGRYPDYLRVRDGCVNILDPRLELLSQDVRALGDDHHRKYDFLFSSSVLEHLDAPIEITRALAQITAKEGFHIHFIDLRDHFFRYPFEMLTFNDRIWMDWLNPTSNLNRFRIADYLAAFEPVFEDVKWEALSQDVDAFMRTLPRIRPDFLSGDPAVDSITRIVLIAQFPS